MKVSKIVRILALSVILTLLIPLLPTPVHAAEYLTVFPREARIGDYMELDGRSFREVDSVFIEYIAYGGFLAGEIDEDVVIISEASAVEFHIVTDSGLAGEDDKVFGGVDGGG